jgi:tRNA dimethylallyltransferase
MNTLIVITGPTASGKTDISVNIALRYGCDIISADSRQIYSGLCIGTAAPSDKQLSMVKHHLVGFLPVTEYYSASIYEQDVIRLLPSLFGKIRSLFSQVAPDYILTQYATELTIFLM